MSDMKCPFCGDEMKLTSLYMDGNHRYSHKYIGALSGGKDRCPFDGETLPLRALQEIHRTRKALENARESVLAFRKRTDIAMCALAEINKQHPDGCNKGWYVGVARKALKQIKALEQKE